MNQLRVTQKMVECSSRMECAFCHALCRSEKFYQHLIDKHSHQLNNPHQLGEPVHHNSYMLNQTAPLTNNSLNMTCSSTVAPPTLLQKHHQSMP